jgi:cation diffusion facilitator family transporter
MFHGRDFHTSEHSQEHHDTQKHTHNIVDPALLTTRKGIWAVKWSLIGLAITALLQAFVVLISGSVALLADTIHNLGDATTAVPLWIAFVLAHRAPSRRFTYGYGRLEDFAGVIIVLIILLSAVVAGYEAVDRLLNPRPVEHLGMVALASLIGFAGNELVANLRIRVGKQIHSAALVADGYHARVDGLTSLAVLIGAAGVWLGYPLADPLVGLLITAIILWIVWDSGRTVLARLADGVDPEVIDEIKRAVNHTQGVRDVTQVRARWLGHRLHAEVNLAVDPELSVAEGHAIAMEVRHQLLHRLPYLWNVTIHVDPTNQSGEEFHRITEHTHDGLPVHSHS